MSKEIRQKQAYLRSVNKNYTASMVKIPHTDWPGHAHLKMGPVAVFRSSQFLAQVFDELDGARRISIQRTMIDEEGEWLQGISWDDLMRVKTQCGYPNVWAVEIYPSTDQIVNVANMRHIWLLPHPPDFAWKSAI